LVGRRNSRSRCDTTNGNGHSSLVFMVLLAALLKGANDYGWGRWEALCADPRYPFRAMAVAKMKEAGVSVPEPKGGGALDASGATTISTGETKEEAMEVEEERKEKPDEDEEGEEKEEKRLVRLRKLLDDEIKSLTCFLVCQVFELPTR